MNPVISSCLVSGKMSTWGRVAGALPLASLFLMREINPSSELQSCRELTDHLSFDFKSWLFSPSPGDYQAGTATLVVVQRAGI